MLDMIDMIDMICICMKYQKQINIIDSVILMTSRLKASTLSSLTSQGKKKTMDKSLEEQVYEMEIHNIEAERLRKTFHRICGNSTPSSNTATDNNYLKNDKDTKTSLQTPKDKFDKKDVIRVLTELNFPYNKPEVDQWIWQVDEDLDGFVNQYEFTLMYKRCIFDKTGLEPRNLFNFVQFLMYDLSCRGKITVEDTLELIYVRHPSQLQLHIAQIFGDKEKTEDGQERQVLFEEYLRQMRKTDLQRRKKLEEERKTVTKPKLNKAED